MRSRPNTILCIIGVAIILVFATNLVSITQLPPYEQTSAVPPKVEMLTSLQQVSVEIDLPQVSDEPIAFIGHGVMFDKNSKRIEVTSEFIEEAQKYYLDHLYEQADESQRSLFEEKQNQLFRSGKRRDTQSEALVNALLIDWLLEEVKPKDAGSLIGKNNLMKRAINSGKLSQELTELLTDIDVDDGVLRSSTFSGGINYINECTAAGVPRPPDWGSNLWVSKGELTNEFISAEFNAEVYVYDSDAPEGLCIALPRSSGNTITLLGIICLGKSTSNACFWDNQKNKMGFKIPKGTALPLTDFAGGADLFGGDGGICTDCHAGENPFVIHPGTVLGQPSLNGLDLNAANWHRPLVHPDWPQNPGPTNILDNVASTGKCNTCHAQGASGGRFPELSTELNGYCSAILGSAISKTMPPGNPSDPNYQAHIDALRTACNTPPGQPLCNGTIYVNAAHTGAENGASTTPFRTIRSAYDYACNGATLKIKGGSYSEILTMQKQINVLSVSGTVTIGQ